MRVIFAASLASIFAGTAAAQATNLIGVTAGFNNSYTTRFNQATTDGDLLQHFDTRHYRYGILDRADPTGATMRFIALSIRLQDQNIATQDTYNLVGYLEDPLAPDFPDTANNRAAANPALAGPGPGGVWFRTNQIIFPVTGTGVAGRTLLVGVNPPATPRGGLFGPNLEDIWVGVGVNSGTWPTDGLGVIITHASTLPVPATPTLDVPGPRANDVTSRPAVNFVCAVAVNAGPPRLPAGTAIYPASSGGNHQQLLCDIFVQAAGGVAVTQTNQANYPSSLATPTTAAVPLGGTTNMLSGLHPDTNDSQLAGRADDVGFLITERNRPNSICAVLVGFAEPPFGVQPLSGLFPHPGSRGMLCIDPGGDSMLATGTSNAAGVFQMTFALTPAVRAVIPTLQPLEVIWQGFVIDPTFTEVIGTGCVTQHL